MSTNRTLIMENQNDKSSRQAFMNKIIQLRKISNHPFLFETIEERLAQSVGRKNGVIIVLIYFMYQLNLNYLIVYYQN